MSPYHSRFTSAWNAHCARHGTPSPDRKARLISTLQGRVLQQLRQEDEHNHSQNNRRENHRTGRATTRLRLKTWATGTVQAKAWKARNQGKTSHPKGFHPEALPHPLLRAYAKLRALR